VPDIQDYLKSSMFHLASLCQISSTTSSCRCFTCRQMPDIRCTLHVPFSFLFVIHTQSHWKLSMFVLSYTGARYPRLPCNPPRNRLATATLQFSTLEFHSITPEGVTSFCYHLEAIPGNIHTCHVSFERLVCLHLLGAH
jgi:hypothetical protein